MTGFIASIVEALGELRVNKGRILLSLIGVAFSVFALTAVLGAGGMLSSALEQSFERTGGRDKILTVYPSGGGEVTGAEQDELVLEQVDRLGIDQRSRKAYASTRVQTPQGVRNAEVTGVDPAYAGMYRMQPEEGRWIADSDRSRLAPALVVNQPMYEALGRPALGSEPVTLYGESGTQGTEQAVIIGVLPADEMTDYGLMAYMAVDAMDTLPGMTEESVRTSEYVLWVPPEQSDEIMDRLATALRDTPAGSFDVFPSSFSVDDIGFGVLRNAIVVVALLVLLLGGMGLVNISLVTVRYRVREIGIRRSYGATGGRIFFGVLMESVVATVVAGAVGVAGAVALVKAPFVTSAFENLGLVDVPPFPISAVLAGLIAATAVGVLAGALPALIATRIRVIDAIRS
ncbi:ABC transporter permease [Brachybacterium sp. J153]|uniref:ABC transporter permease n=1 Tax=Brachybacterium sp. J153 TaxID=3116488 RepID=UPI002E7A2E48|nr:ABC transporter permease [Brachybacterium sp. J153]MEE1619707.1 ABC transporter permease [Brachybacterium sp. J153]